MFRLSVAQYHQMIDSGTLTADDPVELVEGILLYKMPRKPLHSGTVEVLGDLIRPMLPPGYRYRSEQPVALDDGEPEPHGAVVSQTRAQGLLAHPSASQIALVIEVSDSTLDRDRGSKLRSYARAGIGCYWIVNLIDRQIEVYTQPDTAANPPTYAARDILKPGGLVPICIGDREVGRVPVEQIIPV